MEINSLYQFMGRDFIAFFKNIAACKVLPNDRIYGECAGCCGSIWDGFIVIIPVRCIQKGASSVIDIHVQ